jgi:hypothetical protein
MRKTPNAWHLAFPTLFPPVFNNGVWSYYGQQNTNHVTRDRFVTRYPSWHKWNIRRFNGCPAKHPSLALVLANEHYNHQLFGQGRVCLETKNMGDSMYPYYFMESMRGPGSSGDTVSKHLCHFAVNVMGTDQYWQYMGSNFCATAFFHSHAHKRQPNMFHTLSPSNFNDPHFHILIVHYSTVVENNPDLQHTIMSDKCARTKAIHAYNHVVTHYFSCKIKFWILFLFLPVTTSFISMAFTSLDPPTKPSTPP